MDEDYFNERNMFVIIDEGKFTNDHFFIKIPGPECQFLRNQCTMFSCREG